jgi:ferricrocin synthase
MILKITHRQTVRSEGMLYVHAFITQLCEGTVVDWLRRAWTIAISALQVLRTSFYFETGQGKWTQVVHSAPDLSWREYTFTTREDLENKLTRYIDEVRPRQENDFASPPLWFGLFRSTLEETHRLVVVMHHALYDGISIQKLFDFVQSIYKGTHMIPKVQFTDLLRDIIYQEEAGVPYWVETLKGIAPLRLRSRIYNEATKFHTTIRAIDLDINKMNHLLQTAGVTTQCISQVAWAKTLAALSGTRDIVFGRVVSGRSLRNAEDVIGPVLVSTLISVIVCG